MYFTAVISNTSPLCKNVYLSVLKDVLFLVSFRIFALINNNAVCTKII